MSSGTHTGPVITRFAPSPTGHLHIGGARSALFCWAYAKRAELEHVAKGGTPGQGGRFMIRIEDTDQARSSEESARGILEDLAWLGIEWDDGPKLKVKSADGSSERVIGDHARDVGSYFQAQRVALYNAYIEYLMSVGRAYPAFDTSDELDRMRKTATAAKQTFKYPRPSDFVFGQPCTARLERAKKGEPHVVRFAMDPNAVVVPDEVLGEVKIAPGEVDDFVIRKADGFPTYHFAVVIDDELMGVTHVMRAQEHLANTPRHVALQRALKRLDTGAPFRTPVYGHMPLIFNMDSTKMSKRDKAKAARKAVKDMMAKDKSITGEAVSKAVGLDGKLVSDFIAAENDNLEVATAIARTYNVPLPEIEIWDFRQSGYLPDAIINFIALLGWNPGMKLEDGKDLEKFDRDFLARNFSIERIGRTNAKFDRAKLLSFNADSINALSDAEFARRWREFLAEYEPDALRKLDARGSAAFTILASAVKPRARTLRDGLNAVRFAMAADHEYPFDAKSMDKIRKGDEKNGPGVNGPRTGIELLGAVRERLASLSQGEWNPGMLHTLLEQLAQQLGIGIGQLAQPLRVAVTGAGVSPGIAETLGCLGRDSTLARIDRCLQAACQ